MVTIIPGDSEKIITLANAAKALGVQVETLLKWNELNILKPTITQSGEIAYKQDQIEQFLALRQPVVPSRIKKTKNTSFPLLPFLSITPAVAILTVVLLSPWSAVKPLSGASENYTPVVSSSLPPENGFVLAATGSGMISYAQTVSEPVFDADGNLAALPVNHGFVPQGDMVKQGVDLNLLLVIGALGLLISPLFLRKQASYTAEDPKDGLSGEQKIIEISQKTDGTIVLCYHDQEFKVSKPELDSESDQLIDRLMTLTGPEGKVIDYEAVGDSEVRLTAPLSQLVTRLGFVGIKRDLFFPRTSKNRVLFRRFVTRKDLDSMNLNADKLNF